MDVVEDEYISCIEKKADGSLKLFVLTPLASKLSAWLLTMLTSGNYGYEYEVVLPRKFRLELVSEERSITLQLSVEKPELMPLLEHMFSGKVWVEASKLDGQLVVSIEPRPTGMGIKQEIALA